MRRSYLSLLLVSALMHSSGCDSDDETPASTTGEPEATVSYLMDVWPIIDRSCRSCHSDEKWHPGFLLTDAATSYQTLTTDPPDTVTEAWSVYIVPGDPDSSILIDKLEKAMPGYGGEKMPPASEPQLSAEELAIFRTWVAEGAPNN